PYRKCSAIPPSLSLPHMGGGNSERALLCTTAGSRSPPTPPRSMTSMTVISGAPAATHAAAIADQFTRPAEQFAASPTHHNQAALDLLVDAADPRAGDVSLDVACGPGSVVCAFARRVRQAVGLDATEAMLAEARRLAAERALDNVAWHLGDVYALPFADGAF